MKKKRYPLLDILVSRYPDYTREQLEAFVVCRNVRVNGELCTRPRERYQKEVEITFHFEKYVSRGGYKLEAALDRFAINVEGMVMLDAGSSTGGFTDCLLQRGAKAVHAVDVGTNQLEWKMRSDPRVFVHERQNIMTLESLDPPAEGAVCDLSFRSISGAATHILSLCGNSFLISLIKPQFEAPRDLEGFDGVVRDPLVIKDILLSVYDTLIAEGIAVKAVTPSPITGHKGNQEFLALLTREGSSISREQYLKEAFPQQEG